MTTTYNVTTTRPTTYSTTSTTTSNSQQTVWPSTYNTTTTNTTLNSFNLANLIQNWTSGIQNNYYTGSTFSPTLSQSSLFNFTSPTYYNPLQYWSTIFSPISSPITNPPRPAPLPIPSPIPSPVASVTKRILESKFLSNANGTMPTNRKLEYISATTTGKVSVGDKINIRDNNNNLISTKTLTEKDVYDIRFRENMVKNTESIGTGWGFSSKLVELSSSSKLASPEMRYAQGQDGQYRFVKVVERNQFWEVIQDNGSTYMQMRKTDNNGQPVKPSDALNDVFNNRSQYKFDCASPMPLLNLKSTLDTIGADQFNKNAGQLTISSWYDQYDQTKSDGGYSFTGRVTQTAGEVRLSNGTTSLKGEATMFDPSKGDALVVGNSYYFDLPGDMSTAQQGWNCIYLGQNTDGTQKFWTISAGIQNVSFAPNSYEGSGMFKNYYLGSLIAAPNTERLQAWATS